MERGSLSNQLNQALFLVLSTLLAAVPALAGVAKDSYTIKCSMQQKRNDGTGSAYAGHTRICTARVTFQNKTSGARADKVLSCTLSSGNSACSAARTAAQLGLGDGWDMIDIHVDPQISSYEVFNSGCTYVENSPSLILSVLAGPCSSTYCGKEIYLTANVAHKFVCAK